MLWDAANVLGDPQVRNLGTIGGSLAHADPAADYPAVMLALEAEFTVAGPVRRAAHQSRRLLRGMFETNAERARDPHRRERSTPRRASAYVKFHHPASHYAVVGAAAVLKLDGGKIANARIALTGLYETALRAPARSSAR